MKCHVDYKYLKILRPKRKEREANTASVHKLCLGDVPYLQVSLLCAFKLFKINDKRRVEFKQALINCTNSSIPSTDLGIRVLLIDFFIHYFIFGSPVFAAVHRLLQWPRVGLPLAATCVGFSCCGAQARGTRAS